MSAPSKLVKGPMTVLPPELIPSVEHLVTEDDKPVDNIYAEKQQRLLTASLYTGWAGPGDDRTFVAMTNVGMFYAVDQPPLVPDCLLSLDVRFGDVRQHRSYFFWVFGKAPDVVLEVVSNRESEELGEKFRLYAQIAIPYYGIWDPEQILSKKRLQVFGLRIKTYKPLAKPWFPEIGLGLTEWHGVIEDMEDTWLRWCGEGGKLVLTGDELAEQAKKHAELADKRAEKAERRAERLAQQLRQAGIQPKNGNS